jgi:anti-sigma regulatory factor (Ser/Thr protein kinase)
MPRPIRDDIRSFILERVEEHPRDIATTVARQFGVSRVTANNYLRRLVDEGAISAEGNTKSRRYAPIPIEIITDTVEIVPGLEDDTVWRSSIRPALRNENQNIIDICAYGFTEMFNNAIDHSGSIMVQYALIRYHTRVQLIIHDYGVGIFEKIKRYFNLYDRREAILELSKGKLTSSPEAHSGEGIFFTSRMFDVFTLSSLDLSYVRIKEDDDQWLIEVESNEAEIPGTRVFMEISLSASRTAKAIFDKYVDDEYRFSKTHVPIALAKIGEDQLVSRSQAKRVLGPVDISWHPEFDRGQSQEAEV